MVEPLWLEHARKQIGVTEIKGPHHNQSILEYWKQIKRGGIKDDETPWCAALLGACLEIVGIKSSRFESAKSYLTWGIGISKPLYGCVVVFGREGGGHVGFVVGKDEQGNLLVLGGNQADTVSIKAFPTSRVLAYRYPIGYPLPDAYLQVGSASLSSGEA